VRTRLTANRWALLAIFVALLLATFGRADEALYGVAVQTDVMVPMRDRVALATDVYLPARDGKAVTEKWPGVIVKCCGREVFRRRLVGV
jgi:predicted acyl esterase